MSLTTLDKYNLKGFIKKSHISELKYGALIRLRGKNKFTDGDLLSFFKCEIENRFKLNSNIIDKHICKYLFCVTSVIVYNFEYVKSLSQEELDEAHLALDMCVANIECGSEEDRSVIVGIVQTLNSKLIDFGMIDKKLYSKRSESVDSTKISFENTEKIQSLKKEISSLKKALKGASDDVLNKDREIDLLEKSLSSIESEKDQLIQQAIDLQRLVDEYKNELDEANAKISSLDESVIDDLKNNIASLNRTIEMKERLVSMYVGRDNKEKYLKDIETKILMMLSGRGFTFDELFRYLKNDGYTLSESDLKQVLINLGKNVQITNPNNLTFPIVYKIYPAYEKRDMCFSYDLGDKNNCLDVMVISDLHMFKVDGLKRGVLNSVYEYCSKIGINLILDLGDFTDYSHNEDSVYKGVCYTKSVLERMIEEFPYDKNIVHALLGGNHDQSLLNYGIDFIGSLSEARTDFVSLGYEHAAVKFSSKANIMLHHMNIKRSDSISDDTFEMGELINKIKAYYKKKDINRNDYYIDLLGHFHKSSLDLVNGIGTVPSLFKNREFDGAWHLKIYFNTDKSIKHIVIIPLIRYNNKLISNGEINYQKLNLKR